MSGNITECSLTNSQPDPRASSIIWIVAANAISQLESAGASNRLIDEAFRNNHTYVYGTPPGDVGVPTAYYTSYADIKTALATGRLPGRYKAVIYDNEHWSKTPLTEQQKPKLYERMVADLLRANGLIYIATPAPDLTWATGNPGEDSYQAYMQRGIPGTAARYAQIIDIQAQVRETRLPYFKDFVTAAVRQARKANPRVSVLIGLRANPNPYTGNAAIRKLSAAYNAVAGIANGYWLNVNGYPQPAVCLLKQIYGSGPTQ